VLKKRQDGFHELETTFIAVDLFDELQFTRRSEGGVEFTWEAPDPAFDPGDFVADESNLIMRATRLVEQECGFQADIRIKLKKNIPIAAGLGGGSADAAAVLMALNRIFGLKKSRSELISWGSQLGSDIPFFLGESCALGQGRGEILRPQSCYRDWWAVLICPRIAVSAREIYGALDLTDHPSDGDTPLCLDGVGFFRAIGRLRNDLEETVVERAPVVAHWRGQLATLGAQGSFVSGSGPTVVGVFDAAPGEELIAKLRRPDIQLFVVEPVRTSMAMVIG
jgi:4-diphosphocytidyl-2-C-methyl-D-erythritol kinase